MMFFKHGLILSAVFLSIGGSKEVSPHLSNLKHSKFYDERFQVIEKINNNQTLLKAFQESVDLINASPVRATSFSCPILKSPEKPTSVHELMPGDIDVVAALGDSITAGFGILAKGPIELLQENRGRSWSIGGDETIAEVSTLPNILRMYNPDLKGYAVGSGFGSGGKYAHLNVAVSGARSTDMPEQARDLVAKLKADTSIDYNNDWKVITLFIGGNDLCASCHDSYYNSVTYGSQIQEALDIMQAEIPRAMVNLVTVLNVALLRQLNVGVACTLYHTVECNCAAFLKDGSPDLEHFEQVVDDFQAATDAIVDSGRYEVREDFTVVTQPFFRNTVEPRDETGKPDISYFAPDCFHLSEKGHGAAAEALWNNMVEPVGYKRNEWHLGEGLECPTQENPYFTTSKNSKAIIENKMLRGFKTNPGASTEVVGPSINMLAVVVGGCVLLLLAVVLVIVIRRRGRQYDLEETTHLLPQAHI